jgi:FAD dependent oxidoreductase
LIQIDLLLPWLIESEADEDMNSYLAKRTPQFRGPAAWSAILPGQDAPIVLDMELTADGVIIGAGFAGLSAALRLQQLSPKANIIVLDAVHIAESTCGRNAGFMIDLPHEIRGEGYEDEGTAKNRKQIALNRNAIAFAKSAVERFGIDRNHFDPAGKVKGASSEKADGLHQS